MKHRHVVPLLLLVAACQGETRAPADAGAGASAAREPEPIRLVASEYAFTSVPDTVQPGWHRVVVVNTGKAPHMAVIARLDSGRTITDFLAAARAGKPTPPSTEVGGPNAVMPDDSLATAGNLPAGN